MTIPLDPDAQELIEDAAARLRCTPAQAVNACVRLVLEDDPEFEAPLEDHIEP